MTWLGITLSALAILGVPALLRGRILCWLGRHKIPPQATVSATMNALGFRVGDGPFRLATADERFAGDFYVTAIHENRLDLTACSRCARRRR